MEDQFLSSLCIDPGSYCSFSEQRKALEQCKALQRTIPLDCNTYIHLVVPILTHWVAVQVAIYPFTLESFPGQTFFSSNLRYGPCCRQIDNSDTFNVVRSTVQNVVDCFYRPVCWNYTLSQCCALDGTNNIDNEQCVPTAKSKFQAYVKSAYNTSRNFSRDNQSTAESLAHDCSTLASSFPHNRLALVRSSDVGWSINIASRLAPTNSTNTNPTNTEAPFPQGQPTSIDAYNILDGASNSTCRALHSSSASLKRRLGDTTPREDFSATGLSAKRQRNSKEDMDAQLIKNTVDWLTQGLNTLSLQNLPSLATMSDIAPIQPKEGPHSYTRYLWACADEVESVSATINWSLRYLAACSSLVDVVFGSSTCDMDSQSIKVGRHRHTIQQWRFFAEIINSITNYMLPSWKNEAYLIYSVFADRGHILSSVARLSKERRMAFVSGVVNALQRLPTPTKIEGATLFNPVEVLGRLPLGRSYEDICRAIGLPLAITHRTIENGGSSVISNIGTLCHRLNDCHIALTTLHAKWNSRLISIPCAVSATNQATYPRLPLTIRNQTNLAHTQVQTSVGSENCNDSMTENETEGRVDAIQNTHLSVTEREDQVPATYASSATTVSNTFRTVKGGMSIMTVINNDQEREKVYADLTAFDNFDLPGDQYFNLGLFDNFDLGYTQGLI
ncbi:hypothetical protein G7Y89_g3582 [Cudoniella acicularis]|uniref:Uncharacterized protein n=1 Tax=Cudoniella acicularis TaxID=354080 RepID=A0A8H4W5G7_9HELO|nr:hypothetical protein G7Y89_g3582 [Cudoniella acicularis]